MVDHGREDVHEQDRQHYAFGVSRVHDADYLRAIVRETVYRFLDCGILESGFARARANPAVTNLWSDSAAKQDVCVRVATKSVRSCGPMGPLSSCLKMSLTGRSFSPSPSA